MSGVSLPCSMFTPDDKHMNQNKTAPRHLVLWHIKQIHIQVSSFKGLRT